MVKKTFLLFSSLEKKIVYPLFSSPESIPCYSTGFATCLGYLEVTAVYYAGDNAKPEARLWPSFEDSAQKYRVPFDETNPLTQLYLLLRGIGSNFALNNFLLNIHPPSALLVSYLFIYRNKSHFRASLL